MVDELMSVEPARHKIWRREDYSLLERGHDAALRDAMWQNRLQPRRPADHIDNPDLLIAFAKFERR